MQVRARPGTYGRAIADTNCGVRWRSAHSLRYLHCDDVVCRMAQHPSSWQPNVALGCRLEAILTSGSSETGSGQFSKG